MNYYALFYEVVDDFVNRRVPFRQEHLRLANEARERGEIVFAGALAEPASALIVFHVDEKTKVESFARKDPYVQNGLVKKCEVRLWNVVVGNEPTASSAVPPPHNIFRPSTAPPRDSSRAYRWFSPGSLPVCPASAPRVRPQPACRPNKER